MNDLIVRLAEKVKKYKGMMVLTGAGISTESGIPDFRSPETGLWTKIDPMKALSVTALRSDPAAFYRYLLNNLFEPAISAKPNPAHYALARLEEKGWVHGVITQNIDSLHYRAGSKTVYEIHGHMRTGHCQYCGRKEDFAAVMERAKRGELPPRCRCGGVIRPDVVLFEDPMPGTFQDALAAISFHRFLLVVGSSLEVAPACYLPSYAEEFAMLNKTPTALDHHATVAIYGKAGEVLPELVKYLENNP